MTEPLSPKDWASLASALREVTPPPLPSDLINADSYIRRAVWKYMIPAMERLGERDD